MSLTNFFKFVEIQTKLASMIPFIVGTLYSLYRFKSFSLKNFIIMSISLLAFDMATTSINNYIDYKKASKGPEYDKGNKNMIVIYNIKESTAVAIIYTLLSIAVFFGILLTLSTNIVVLLIGMVSFLAGIFYTYGPVPISRMPLGEIFSGIFMGFIILFLSCYIHVFDRNIISLIYHNNIMNISINLLEMFYIFLIAIPTINGIANIMLANNICDVEEDIINNRFTLPYYLGVKNSLKLFKALYYMGYLGIILSVILKISPIVSLLVILTIIPISKNVKIFCNNPIKSKTFVLSVQNFAIMNITHILLLLIVIIFN